MCWVLCIDVWWVVKLPITHFCPIAWFVLWLYFHSRIYWNVVNIALVEWCFDLLLEVRIMLTVVLYLWVLWIGALVVG